MIGYSGRGRSVLVAPFSLLLLRSLPLVPLSLLRSIPVVELSLLRTMLVASCCCAFAAGRVDNALNKATEKIALQSGCTIIRAPLHGNTSSTRKKFNSGPVSLGTEYGARCDRSQLHVLKLVEFVSAIVDSVGSNQRRVFHEAATQRTIQRLTQSADRLVRICLLYTSDAADE